MRTLLPLVFSLFAYVSSDEVTCDAVKALYQHESDDGSCCSGKIAWGNLTCVDPLTETVDAMSAELDLLKARLYTTDADDEFGGVYQGFLSTHTAILARSPTNPDSYDVYGLEVMPTTAKGFAYLFAMSVTTLPESGRKTIDWGGTPMAFKDETKTILTSPDLFWNLKRIKRPSEFPNPKNWFEEYLTTVQFEDNRIDTSVDPLISMRDNWERMRYTFQMNTVETKYRDIFTDEVFDGQRFQDTGYDLMSLHRRLGYTGVTNEMHACTFSPAITGHEGRLLKVACPIEDLMNQGMIPMNIYSKIHVRNTGTELDDMPYLLPSLFDKQHAFATLRGTPVRSPDSFYFYLRMPMKTQGGTISMTIASNITGTEQIVLRVPSGYYYPQDLLAELNKDLRRKTNANAYFDFAGSNESPSKNRFVFVGGTADVSHSFTGSSGSPVNLFRDVMKGFPPSCDDSTGGSGSLAFTGQYGTFGCAAFEGFCGAAPYYANENNVTAANACCVCGGGVGGTDQQNFGLGPDLYTPMSLTATGSIEYTHGPVAGATDPSDVMAAYADLILRAPEMHSSFGRGTLRFRCRDGYGEVAVPRTWKAWKRGCATPYTSTQFEFTAPFVEEIHAPPQSSADAAAASTTLSYGKTMQLAFNDEQRQYLAQAKGFGSLNYFVNGGYYIIKTTYGEYRYFPIHGDLSTLDSGPLIQGSTFGIIRPDIMEQFGKPDEVVGVMSYTINSITSAEYEMLEKVVLPYFKRHNVTQIIVDQRGNGGGYYNPDALLVGGDAKFPGRLDEWLVVQSRGALVGDVVDVMTTNGKLKSLDALNASLYDFIDYDFIVDNAYYNAEDDMYYVLKTGANGNGGMLQGKLVGTPEKKLNMVILIDTSAGSAPQAIKNVVNSMTDPVTGEYPDGSNVRGCSIGEEPHLFGTGSYGYFTDFATDLYPFEPTRRGQEMVLVGGKERLFTDDFHHRYNKVDATVASSYENFMKGIGLAADSHITGVEFTNVSTWRDLSLEQAIRAAVTGCENVIAAGAAFDDLTALPRSLTLGQAAPPFPPPSPLPPATPPSPPPPPCTGAEPVVTIYIGTWGEENSVTFQKDGEVVWQTPTYTNADNGATYTYGMCLPAGTYTAVLEDSYGDGWNSEGYIQIVDEGVEVLPKTYHPAGSTKTVEFELKLSY